MRPGADRYTPDDTADRPTSSAESGFAEAYRLHRPGLVKLAAFIVGDQATGEDVVQDVFTRLHQRWHMLADPGDPLPYLRTAVVNGCRSAIRRRGRAQRHAGQDSPSPPLSTEESVLLSEDRQQVLAALVEGPFDLAVLGLDTTSSGGSLQAHSHLLFSQGDRCTVCVYTALTSSDGSTLTAVAASPVPPSQSHRSQAPLYRESVLQLSLVTGQPSGILYTSAAFAGGYVGLVPVLSGDGQAQHWFLVQDPEQFGWISGGKLVPLPIKASAGLLAIGW